MLQYPHYKDLSSFIKKNPIVNLPIENITYFMLKVSTMKIFKQIG